MQTILALSLLAKFVEIMDENHKPVPFDIPSKTYNASYSGGECSKHGRYYGSCASCTYEYRQHYIDQENEFKMHREKKLMELKKEVEYILEKGKEPYHANHPSRIP